MRIQYDNGWEVDCIIDWDQGTMVHFRPGDMGLDLAPAGCVTPLRTNSSSVRRAGNTSSWSSRRVPMKSGIRKHFEQLRRKVKDYVCSSAHHPLTKAD